MSDTSIIVIYHGMSLTVLYMSNMAGVLQETRTTFPSQAPGFLPGCWWGPCCSSFQFSVLCFCFVCLRPVFFVAQCCQCYVLYYSGLSYCYRFYN